MKISFETLCQYIKDCEAVVVDNTIVTFPAVFKTLSGRVIDFSYQENGNHIECFISENEIEGDISLLEDGSIQFKSEVHNESFILKPLGQMIDVNNNQDDELTIKNEVLSTVKEINQHLERAEEAFNSLPRVVQNHIEELFTDGTGLYKATSTFNELLNKEFRRDLGKIEMERRGFSADRRVNLKDISFIDSVITQTPSDERTNTLVKNVLEQGLHLNTLFIKVIEREDIELLNKIIDFYPNGFDDMTPANKLAVTSQTVLTWVSIAASAGASESLSVLLERTNTNNVDFDNVLSSALVGAEYVHFNVSSEKVEKVLSLLDKAGADFSNEVLMESLVEYLIDNDLPKIANQVKQFYLEKINNSDSDYSPR